MTIYLAVWLFGWAQFQTIDEVCGYKPARNIDWDHASGWIFQIEAKCESCQISPAGYALADV